MTEEGSRVETVGPFLRIYDRNGALLMKEKRSQNRLYKVLLKDYQHVLYWRWQQKSEEETNGSREKGIDK